MIEVFTFLGVLYIALFLLSIKIQDNSIADVFWGFGFTVIAWVSLYSTIEPTLHHYILNILVIFWGSRLTLHIYNKKISHNWEDPRYAKWRKTWEYFYIRSFFQVYLLQGVLMCLIATPIFLMNLKFGISYSFIITTIWSIVALWGLIYEIKADRQLANFINTKKTWEILTTWLRKYHRYPQYFGESIFWLGICIIASQVSVLAFVWWWVITFLLLKVSGVPMLEKRYDWNKVYQKYSQYTPKFIPNYFL